MSIYFVFVLCAKGGKLRLEKIQTGLPLGWKCFREKVTSCEMGGGMFSQEQGEIGS